MLLRKLDVDKWLVRVVQGVYKVAVSKVRVNNTFVMNLVGKEESIKI